MKANHTLKTTDALALDYMLSHNDINTVKNHLDRFISMLKGRKILDVGCGSSGRDINYFNLNRLHAIGIDLSVRSLTLAKLANPLCCFIEMDMKDTDFKDGTFDGIWSCGSFYHIEKMYAKLALHEFHRLLKPGGILFVAVKNGEKEMHKIIRKGYKKYYSYYLPAEITQLIHLIGFDIIDTVLERKEEDWINVYAKKQRNRY